MAKRKAKTLGQVAYEAASPTGGPIPWTHRAVLRDQWERIAAAVEAEVLRRIGMTAEEAKAFEAIPKRKRKK